jgi:hypothetical protein
MRKSAAWWLVLLLVACGGEDETPERNACGGWGISIQDPTSAPRWETDRQQIDVSGWAPNPGGPYSGNCPGDPGHIIDWQNEATGQTGSGGAWSSKTGWGACTTGWYIRGIPLEMGENRILVTMTDANGVAGGSDCIIIDRLPEAPLAGTPT